MPKHSLIPEPGNILELSIIIVSYRHRQDLELCLPSIYAQTYKDFEVVLVDNSPGDGTAEWLVRQYPEVKLIANPANTGYAGGNNLGFREARGEWLLVLNPDTELHTGALETLVRAAKANPDALITPKLLQSDGTINACGNQMHYTGITTCRGLGKNPKSFQGLEPVPLLSGAAFIASKKVMNVLGGFDENYFGYVEETDLSLRARLRGYRILCAAEAVITHHYRLGMSPRKFYLLERNRLLTLFKVYSRNTLLRLLPALLLTELATWAFALLRGPAYLRSRWQGYAWLWRTRQDWQRRRTEVQAQRTTADEELLRDAQLALPFDQLVDSPALAHWLDRLTQPLYRLVRPLRARA